MRVHLVRMSSQDWHSIDNNDLYDILDTSPEGLSSKEVELRQVWARKTSLILKHNEVGFPRGKKITSTDEKHALL